MRDEVKRQLQEASAAPQERGIFPWFTFLLIFVIINSIYNRTGEREWKRNMIMS